MKIRILDEIEVPDGCDPRDILLELAESNAGSEFLANADYEIV